MKIKRIVSRETTNKYNSKYLKVIKVVLLSITVIFIIKFILNVSFMLQLNVVSYPDFYC